MRIATLLPSATEMVHFAGAGDSLVGVTHECDFPSHVQHLPTLTSTRLDHEMTSAEIDAAVGNLLTDTGSIYALDAKLLEEVSPDLIITQGLCDVCAVSEDLVRRAASSLKKEPEVLSLNPTSLSEILLDAIRVGEVVGCGKEVREKVAVLEERLARVEASVSGLHRLRVGCIEWLDPLFSAGHWVPEMVRTAGGEEIFAEPGEPSSRLTWEDVLDAAPEVLILMPCGFDAVRTVKEARILPALPGWNELPAVKNGRVWAVDANAYFSRPAPRLVVGVEILALILHPNAFPHSSEPETAVRLDPAKFGASGEIVDHRR